MIISHTRPDILWTLTNGTFVTEQSRLTNGRVTSATRILADDDLLLAGTFNGGEIVPKLAGLIAVSLEPGTMVTCSYKRDGDSGYPYQSQTQPVVQAADGSKNVWFAYPEGLDAVTDVQFSIPLSNIPTAGLYVDIGEMWVGPGSEYKVQPTYTLGLDRLSRQQLSIYGQPYPVKRSYKRSHVIQLIPTRYNGAFVSTDNHITLSSAIARFETCAIVPITSAMFDGISAIDADYVNRHAALCYAEDIRPLELEDKFFTSEFTFTEIPRVT